MKVFKSFMTKLDRPITCLDYLKLCIAALISSVLIWCACMSAIYDIPGKVKDWFKSKCTKTYSTVRDDFSDDFEEE